MSELLSELAPGKLQLGPGLNAGGNFWDGLIGVRSYTPINKERVVKGLCAGTHGAAGGRRRPTFRWYWMLTWVRMQSLLPTQSQSSLREESDSFSSCATTPWKFSQPIARRRSLRASYTNTSFEIKERRHEWRGRSTISHPLWQVHFLTQALI